MWTPGEDPNNKPKEMYDDLSDLEVIQVDINRPISTKPGQKRFVYVEESGFWNESATEWKNAYATWIIVGVLVLAFIFQGIFGEEAVINAGSVNWPTVFGKFQIWRLFTCVLLHSNWEHLIGNLVVLIVCGVLLEKRVARKRVLVTFFAGGLFASLCSAVFNHVLPMQVTFRTFFGESRSKFRRFRLAPVLEIDAVLVVICASVLNAHAPAQLVQFIISAGKVFPAVPFQENPAEAVHR